MSDLVCSIIDDCLRHTAATAAAAAAAAARCDDDDDDDDDNKTARYWVDSYYWPNSAHTTEL